MALYTRKNSPRSLPPSLWLLSFGDMMSLMVCVFIVLFSMGKIDPVKFMAAKQSLGSTFGRSKAKADSSTDGNTQHPLLSRLSNLGKQRYDALRGQAGVQVIPQEDCLQIRIGFDGRNVARGTLKAELTAQITQVAELISKSLTKVVIVVYFPATGFGDGASGSDWAKDETTAIYEPIFTALAIADLLQKSDINAENMSIEAKWIKEDGFEDGNKHTQFVDIYLKPAD